MGPAEDQQGRPPGIPLWTAAGDGGLVSRFINRQVDANRLSFLWDHVKEIHYCPPVATFFCKTASHFSDICLLVTAWLGLLEEGKLDILSLIKKMWTGKLA